MSAIPTGVILEAVNRGEASLPALKRATGFDYPTLLQALEGDLSMAVRREETATGALRFHPLSKASESKVTRIPIGPFCVKCKIECKKTHEAGTEFVGGEVRWMCSKCKERFPGTHVKARREENMAIIPTSDDHAAARERINKIIANGQRSPTEKELLTSPRTEVEDLCGCGRGRNHKGRCSMRRAAASLPLAVAEEAKPLCAECGRFEAENGKLCWDCDAAKVEAGLAEIEGPVAPPMEQVLQPEPPSPVEDTDTVDIERLIIPALTPPAPTLEEARQTQTAAINYSIEYFGEFPPSVVLKKIVWDDDFFMVSYETLLAILDEDMNDAEKEAVWLLLRYLKRVEKQDLMNKFMGDTLETKALRAVNDE